MAGFQLLTGEAASLGFACNVCALHHCEDHVLLRPCTITHTVQLTGVQRCEKETAVAERFWMQQALKAQNEGYSPSHSQPVRPHHVVDADARSMVSGAATSVAPSGYTSKTAVRAC